MSEENQDEPQHSENHNELQRTENRTGPQHPRRSSHSKSFDIRSAEELIRVDARQIVIPVCWGEMSIYTFKWYVTHLHRPDNYVHVIHVPDIRLKFKEGMSSAEILELMKELNAVSSELKQLYEGLLKEMEVDGKFVRVGGNNPWCAIVEYSKRIRATMIVMGSQTMCPSNVKGNACSPCVTADNGNLDAPVISSITYDVIMHTIIPVIVVRKQEERKSLTIEDKIQFWKDEKVY